MSARNALESALVAAAEDPASRPAFFRLLLDSTIYVIGFTDAPEAVGRVTVAAGSELSIAHRQNADGNPYIPFFTSLEALQQASDPETRYVALPARAFFEMTLGALLVLNPASDHGKEFFPQEIETLLATGMNQALTPRVVQKKTPVLLGQPAEYPTEMVSVLARFFGRRPAVKRAFLGLMHDPASDEAPVLLVALEGDGDLEPVLREVGAVVSGSAPQGQPVDFTRITPGSPGVGEYFFQGVEPFYVRKPGSKLRAFFGFGKA